VREILTIIAACIVVALAAALAVPPFIDWTSHGAAIAAKLGEGFGGRVALEGPVYLRLLPAPRLTAGALVAERAGLAVRARETTLELSAPALLRGAFEFTEVALAQADVTLDPGKLETMAPGARVAVAGFRLADATLRIAGAHPLTLAHLDMSGAADTLAGPFRGQGQWRDGRAVEFSFSTGPVEQGKLRGKLAFDDRAQARGEANGELMLIEGAPKFSGQATVASAFGGAPARATFALEANAGMLHADKIEARLGDDDHALNFSGDADFSRAKGLDLRLAAASLDLDRFRAAYNWREISQAAPSIALRARLAVDSMTLGGDALANVAIALDRQADASPRIAVDAGLPGRTRLSYDGALAPAALDGALAPAALDGALKIETRDAGRLAAYVAPAAPQLARWLGAGAFSRLACEGRVRADAQGVTLNAAALDVDRSRLSGAVDWRAATATGRGKLDARLLASVIDIDTLPDVRALAALSSRDDLSLSLDAQALRVERIGEAPAETGRLRLALTRADGVTNLDNLSIVGLGGANLSGAGRMTAQGGGFDFKLDAERLADLAALLRRVAPGPASEAFAARAFALSPARMIFGVAMDASGAFTQINLAGEAGGARYSAQALPSGAGRMQARVSAQAAEAAILLRQAGIAVLPLKGLGGARLEAQGEGAIGAPLRTRASLDLAGLALRFDGETLLAPDRASAQGKLSADSADVSRLAPLFAFGAPDVSGKTPLHGAAHMRFDAQGLALENIDAEIAGTRATGVLTRSLAGALGGALKLDRLSAPDLAALVLGPPQPAAAGALWPTLKFAATRFDPPTADVALDIAHVDLGGGVAGDDAHMQLALAPGAVAARELSMRIGDGRFAGEVALRRDGGAVIARARLTAENMPASSGPLSARIGGIVDLSGAGGSMAELVASLAGSGRLKFSQARIARASPAALPRVVAEADAAESAPDARATVESLARALDGDAQAPPPFESDATIASGRIALAPVALRLGGVDALMSGVFDLRNDTLDLRENLSLPAPAGWTSAPRVELFWSGARVAPTRAVNADALVAALAERAIAREGERNAALEADIHERAFFNRRLKMDRRADEERRALDEAKRLMTPPPARRESAPAPAQTMQPPKSPARPPAAFAPALRGAAPDPSTAGRY
jgi:hypothetical protein